MVDGLVPGRAVSVDGAWGQPGLNLSHWPGNATPPGLRHDLSVGIALEFARLPARERGRLAEGCTAILANHYDTEGVCAVFAVRHPDLALPRAQALLDAGAAGDFFQVPGEDAFRLDAVVSNLDDPARSPWAPRFAGLDDRARHELLLHELVDRLPGLLDGDLGEFRGLWEPELDRLRADLAALDRAARDEVVHLDLAVWTGREAGFVPGRHALFARTRADRVLVIDTSGEGATFRLLLSTLSWFDPVSREALPRPDLAALAARLNEEEGCADPDEAAWRAQATDSPAPQLWFGTARQPRYAEHNACLRPSRLAPALVQRCVADALRASWAFPG